MEKDSDAEKLRCLMIVLAELSKTRGGILSIEKQALYNKKRKISIDEMVRCTPQDLETPEYEVIDEREGVTNNWEVRRYKEFSVCSVSMNKTREGGESFNSLAGYIFGKNEEKKAMKMTTPVITSSSDNEMSFVMPSTYWNESSILSAPIPVTPEVRVKQGPISCGETYAVLWFKGYAFDGSSSRKQQLLSLIETDSNWQLACSNDVPILMQYNDPFVPPWKRRNEVAVKVQSKSMN